MESRIAVNFENSLNTYGNGYGYGDGNGYGYGDGNESFLYIFGKYIKKTSYYYTY